jgi:hypothetical protein
MDRRRRSHLRLPCLCCEFVCGVQTSGEVPRQELLDTGDGMIGDVRQHMPQIGFGIEAVELGRTDEGVEDGGTFASAIGAGEEIVATAHRPGSAPSRPRHDNPTGRAMAGMLAVFAEFEREILRERVKAGIAQARSKGKTLGRPVSVAKKAAEVRSLYRKEKLTKSEIARNLGISRTSVRRRLQTSR